MAINKLTLKILLILGLATINSGCGDDETQISQRGSSQISGHDPFNFDNDPASSSPSEYRLKINGNVTCKANWHDVEPAYLINDIDYEYDFQGSLIQEYLDVHMLKRVYVQYPEKHCLGEFFLAIDCVNGYQVEVFGSVFDSSLQESINKETGELLVNVCHCSRKYFQIKSP